MKTIKEKYQELYKGMRRAEGIAKDQLVDAIYEVVKSEITEHPYAMPQEDWMEYVIDLNDCLHVYLADDVRVCYEAIKTLAIERGTDKVMAYIIYGYNEETVAGEGWADVQNMYVPTAIHCSYTHDDDFINAKFKE